ncbi:hypothetical protein [Streptomyces albus]|uniref:hypothetical protein n=1 Tax=Streptomyces albus TaxID=1888 RepID=UPI0033C7A860
MLLEPRQPGWLSGWLRPGHFYRSAHAALYAAMLDLRTEQHPATKASPDVPVPFAWGDDTCEKAGTHVRGLNSRLRASPARAPRTPRSKGGLCWRHSPQRGPTRHPPAMPLKQRASPKLSIPPKSSVTWPTSIPPGSPLQEGHRVTGRCLGPVAVETGSRSPCRQLLVRTGRVRWPSTRCAKGHPRGHRDSARSRFLVDDSVRR